MIFGVHMRFVSPINLLHISVMIICKHGDPPPKEISSEEKYCRDTSLGEVWSYFIMVPQEALPSMRQQVKKHIEAGLNIPAEMQKVKHFWKKKWKCRVFDG